MFGLGFGMVGQVLIVAVQNGVERRELGIAMATTSFFRALGGAVGAAVLGAVFAARAGMHAGEGGRQLAGAARADVIDGRSRSCCWSPRRWPRSPLIVLLRLPEVPLRSRQDKPQPQPARVPVGASR